MEFDASGFAHLELTDEIRRAYEDDGVLVFRNMFSDGEINNFIERHQSRIDLSERWSDSYLPSRLAFREDSSITDLLCAKQINAVFDMLHTKIVDETRASEELFVLHTSEARLGSSNIAWHRDVIVPIDGLPKYIVVSIALSDIDEDAGRISYIPGSHKWDVDYNIIPAELIKKDSLPGFEYYRKLIADSGVTPISFEAKKGDVLMWNGYVIHQGDLGKDNALRHTLTGHFQVIAKQIGSA